MTIDEDNKKNKNINTNVNNPIIDPFKVGSLSVREVNDCLYGPLGSYFYEYADMYDVDANLMCAIAMQESSLNHKACIPRVWIWSRTYAISKSIW